MIVHKKALLIIAVTLVILIGIHSSAATIRRSQFEQQEIKRKVGGFLAKSWGVFRGGVSPSAPKLFKTETGEPRLPPNFSRHQLKIFLQILFANIIQKNRACLESEEPQYVDKRTQKELTLSAGLQTKNYLNIIGIFVKNSYLKQINQSLRAAISSLKINTNENRDTLSTACYLKATAICAALDVKITAGFRAKRSVLREAILVHLPNKQIITAYIQGKNIYELVLLWLGFIRHLYSQSINLPILTLR